MSAQRGILSGVLATLLMLPAPLDGRQAHHEHGGEGDVGSVEFPVSCAPAAQPIFNRAVAMLHSFWFQEADAEFRAVSEADPGCAMAHWGRAMVYWGNPMARSAPSPASAAAALEAVAEARRLAPRATTRERSYIEAAAALYEGADRAGHLDRMRAHEAALAALVDAHPDDDEAATFLGRIMVANASPDDLTFSRQIRAAEIMEPLFLRHPHHPGLAHYIIHAFDAPPIAQQGLEAARRYAEIAPAAPHALHMPSHIFTRLGHWEESIEMNDRSASAEPERDAAVHPLDYMVYAYLQLGRDREAGDVVARVVARASRPPAVPATYNLAALEARFALEREDWAAAARLEVRDGAPPSVQAVTRFARAVGAARSGDATAAAGELELLEGLGQSLQAAGDPYWATAVQAQILAASAWAARADGRNDEALRLAREGAALEETFEKHPVTPGPLLPARELEADLLADLGRPADALRSYQATLEREPRRARALLGVARTAADAGDDGLAAKVYRELADQLQGADADNPALREVRRALAGTGG